MRLSQMLLPTLREIPADTDSISHQWLLRAGMIRSLAPGFYTWLPLGLRVLRKLEAVVREEMGRAQAQEVLLSGQSSIPDLAHAELRSYRQLPATFYQIRAKTCEESRVRLGLRQAREFWLNEAYRFHLEDASHRATHRPMQDAYLRIFTRLGVPVRVARALGQAGGEAHAFYVLTDAGEDVLAYCPDSDYAAALAVAATTPPAERAAPTQTMAEVYTPGARTIAAVTAYLAVPSARTVKTLLVEATDGGVVALVLRGDHVLDETKALRVPQVATPLTLAAPAQVRAIAGADPGSVGPMGLCPVVCDRAAAAIADFVCGANRDHFHYTGVNWGRDLPEPIVVDLRQVMAGDESPDGKGALTLCRGIEVGRIVSLGADATVVNETGRPIPVGMERCTLGLSRMVAAVVEQNQDARGICWPTALAPFSVVLVPIHLHRSARLAHAVSQLYDQLRVAGMDVLLDDRALRPGVMFADAELIGIPHRLVLSERGLDRGTVEYCHRRDLQPREIPLEEVVPRLTEWR